MFLTGFEDSVVVRFGKLDLVRNIWRKFRYKLDSPEIMLAESTGDFNVGAVNIEENDKRFPLPYRTPLKLKECRL